MGAPTATPPRWGRSHVLFELGDPRTDGIERIRRFRASRKGVPVGAAAVDPDAGRDARGTPTHGRVLRRAKFVSDAHAALFPGGGGGVPLEKFAWALSSVLSRASSGDRMPYAFLPGADLLNHGGVDANCELSAVKLAGGGNEENRWGDVEVTCVADVAAGEQLTISYGDESDNCRLLRLYGFATRGNVHDKREIELRLTGDALGTRGGRPGGWGPVSMRARASDSSASRLAAAHRRV